MQVAAGEAREGDEEVIAVGKVKLLHADFVLGVFRLLPTVM